MASGGLSMIAAGVHYLPAPCPPRAQQRSADEVRTECGESVEGGLWYYYPPCSTASLRRLGLRDADPVAKALRVPPRFWEEVAYGNLPKIQGQYGPLGHPERREKHWRGLYESHAWSLEAVGWLKELTMLAAFWKDRALDPLRERTARLPRNPTMGDLIELEEAHSDKLVIFPAGGTALDPLNVIRWKPAFPSGQPFRRGTLHLIWPDDDSSLLAAIWAAILDSCGRRLSTLPLRLETFSPAPQWAFDCSGSALEAAFCLWYFEEIANLTHPMCQAEGCNNPIPGGRSKFCSTRCADRQRQREHRSKKEKPSKKAKGAKA